jgi:hypothetical protein
VATTIKTKKMTDVFAPVPNEIDLDHLPPFASEANKALDKEATYIFSIVSLHLFVVVAEQQFVCS